jgi:hypothetical protein
MREIGNSIATEKKLNRAHKAGIDLFCLQCAVTMPSGPPVLWTSEEVPGDLRETTGITHDQYTNPATGDFLKKVIQKHYDDGEKFELSKLPERIRTKCGDVPEPRALAVDPEDEGAASGNPCQSQGSVSSSDVEQPSASGNSDTSSDSEDMSSDSEEELDPVEYRCEQADGEYKIGLVVTCSDDRFNGFYKNGGVRDRDARGYPQYRREDGAYFAYEGPSEGPDHNEAMIWLSDVDENEDTAAACGIQAMPTFHFYKGGAKVHEFSGASKEKIEEGIAKLK